jgi:LemA protein
MNVVAALLVVIVIVAVVIAASYAVSYNRLVRRRESVTDSWRTIDAELQRRHQLVPQLVSAVRAAAEHELDILVDLSRRNENAHTAPHTAAHANLWEPPLAAAVAEVIALRERYPSLNSQRNFIELQRELATTEDRIAAARRFYNTRVAELNRAIEAFPSAVVAGRHRFVRAELFGS